MKEIFILSFRLIQHRLLLVCAVTKKLKVLLFVKLREAILTLITSWGTHELVSLSLEMELWQRPPITAINVLKFCSWWSFCVDIKKISIIYMFRMFNVHTQILISTIVLLWSLTSLCHLTSCILVMSCDFTGCNMSLFYCY